MVNSIISSSHHYYVAFFDAPAIRNAISIPKMFGLPHDHEVAVADNSRPQLIYHLQLQMNTAYGSESLLLANRSDQGNGPLAYWYDFYFGLVTPERKTWFLCYPYTKLSKIVEGALKSNFSSTEFYKPDVTRVLNYMRTKGKRKSTPTERSGIDIEITKYTAEVKESANANRVSLVGTNPLNSRIFDILNESDEISVEPTALKLKCDYKNHESKNNQKKVTIKTGLELSFDRLGNFRFWLRKESQQKTLPLLKSAFNFFNDISSLEKSTFLSSHTILEDD